MASGDVKNAYAASSAITVTALQSLATSSTHVAGWESGAIDNSSNLYTDYRIQALIKVAAAGLSAGEIRMHVVAEMNDTTWPDVFDGTESTETVTSVEIRNAICHLVAITATTTTASRSYYLSCPSVRQVLGLVPRKFVIYISQSTGANLDASANAVYVAGSYETVAP